MSSQTTCRKCENLFAKCTCLPRSFQIPTLATTANQTLTWDEMLAQETTLIQNKIITLRAAFTKKAILTAEQEERVVNLEKALIQDKKTALEKKRLQNELTGLQKVLTAIGYVFTGIIALGCGISVAAAFISLSLLSSGAASYFIATMLFVAGTAVNWLIYKNAVPNVLVSMFGKEKIGQGLFEVEGGCDLLSVSEKPSEKIRLIMKSRAAYVRYKSKDGTEDCLYHYDQNTGECIKLNNITPDVLKQFDQEMNVNDLAFNRPKELNYKQLLKITEMTGHSLLSNTKKGWMIFGVVVASAAGIMQGVLTYGGTLTLSNAFAFLGAISPALPAIAGVLAVVTVVSLTTVLLNNIATWVKSPQIMQDFKNYCKKLFDFTTPRCEILEREEKPKANQLHHLSLTYDAAYIRVKNQLYYVDKHSKRCVCLTSDPKVLAQLNSTKKDLNFEDLKQISDLTGHKIKSRGRVIAERALTLSFTLLALPLAALGVFMTMNACVTATKLFLLNTIPNAAVAVVDIVSAVLGLGFAFLGRIPFTVRNAVRTIGHFIDSSLENISKKVVNGEQRSILGKVWEGLKVAALYTCCFMNAIGNGLIAMVGAGKAGGPVWGGVVGGAGTLNSLTAGVASGLLGGASKSSNSTVSCLSQMKIKAKDDITTHLRRSNNSVPVLPVNQPLTPQPSLGRASSTMWSDQEGEVVSPPSPVVRGLGSSPPFYKSTIDLKELFF